MTAISDTVSAAERQRSVIRVIGSSLAGSSLEWYDHAIYGFAAAWVFPKLFFPQSDPFTGTLLSMTIYGVGFLSRPIGGRICGLIHAIGGRAPDGTTVAAHEAYDPKANWAGWISASAPTG